MLCLSGFELYSPWVPLVYEHMQLSDMWRMCQQKSYFSCLSKSQLVYSVSITLMVTIQFMNFQNWRGYCRNWSC